ncbi:hypothetical protein ABZV31_08085 [Streptomyces sp. NPDC005202]|uniref:hypothetical protein n=1 Tax=Streptomyces sp. NPDC005202 TaxID=3157021 RepID=UPI0033ACD7A0
MRGQAAGRNTWPRPARRPHATAPASRHRAGHSAAAVRDVGDRDDGLLADTLAEYIIAIAPDHEPAITAWLAPGAADWRTAPAPLTPDQQRMFVDTLLAYAAAVGEERD